MNRCFVAIQCTEWPFCKWVALSFSKVKISISIFALKLYLRFLAIQIIGHIELFQLNLVFHGFFLKEGLQALQVHVYQFDLNMRERI